MAGLTDQQLQRLYTWIDEIPLTRPKRNISRDFADGVLCAEVIAHYFPRLVELHNYPSANSTQQKLYNWNTLNSKVLRKIGYNLPKDDMEAVIQCRPGAIEKVLYSLQQKMAKYRARRSSSRSGTPTSARGASPAPSERGASPRSVRSDLSVQSRKPRVVTSVQRAPSPAPSVMSSVQNQHFEQPSGPHRATSAQLNSAYDRHTMHQEVDQEILVEKEQTISELRETVEILELQIAKLKQLVRLKDSKISKLQDALSRKMEA